MIVLPIRPMQSSPPYLEPSYSQQIVLAEPRLTTRPVLTVSETLGLPVETEKDRDPESVR